MEPEDVNLSPNVNDDAQLEALLRTAAPVLPDDGFPARVLAALPAAEAERIPWRRIAFCLVGAAAGCGFALWRGVSWPGLQSGLEQFAAALVNAGPALADPLLGAALVVTTLSLLFAFRAELREKLMS
jgi:hypothetical protein